MNNATKQFLEEYTPAAIAEQKARVKEQTEADIATANLHGTNLLNHAPTAQALADLCLDMGYMGGWRGRVDDFNQGVLFAAHMVIDSLGPANKPAILKLIAERAAQRLTKTSR